MSGEEITMMRRYLAGANATASAGATASSANGTAASSGMVQPNDAEVLRDTFVVYGTGLIVSFLLYCIVRKRFPRPYTVRRWSSNDDLKTELAYQQFGFLSWAWRLRSVPDETIREECGMDALCFLRVLKMGFKICLVGCFNAVWLLPLYATAKESPETAYIVDGILMVTIAHVPSFSPRLVGTALAAYILFGYTMYLILGEFEWFVRQRHEFLKKPSARNYAVYVRNIPAEYLTNDALADFFQQSTSCPVFQANLRVKAPALAKQVAKRDAVVAKLEHAMAQKRSAPDGIGPTHVVVQRGQASSSSLLPVNIPLVGGGGEREVVDSVEAYADELYRLNVDIAKRIDAILKTDRPPRDVELGLLAAAAATASRMERPDNDGKPATSSTLGSCYSRGGEGGTEEGRGRQDDDAAFESPGKDRSADRRRHDEAHAADSTEVSSTTEGLSVESPSVQLIQHGSSGGDYGATSKGSDKPLLDPIAHRFLGVVGSAAGAASLATGAAAAAASKASAAAQTVLTGPKEDGEPYTAGFVTFSKLSAVHSTLQMVQHEKPFNMEVFEAPDPDDVFWLMVGRSHKDLQLGLLISLAATTALCLLWTIPIAFFASLSSVAALREQIPFVDQLLTAMPWLEPIFQLLAPLLVKIVNALLPVILEFLSMFEGPVGESVLQASLFAKLSAFMIIQTFFVSAVSGSILQELYNILNNPTSVIDLLANSLPSQATYFIQIAFIGTVISIAMELLRVVPLVLAAIRSFVGPRLTDKERRTTFLGLRPLADPTDFEHADVLSQIVLYFTIQLVYAVIAPITSFVLAFCFLYMGSAYLHQFVFIYPKKPDSGGKLWTKFIRYLLVCMLIAQVTIMGLLLLKKAAIAMPMMIPLLIATVLFNAYIQQDHFRVAEYLPAHECNNADMQNGINFDLSSMEDAYVQPECRLKQVLPETEDPEQELPAILQDDVGLHYLTPEQSEADIQSQSADDVPLALHNSTESSETASFLGW